MATRVIADVGPRRIGAGGVGLQFAEIHRQSSTGEAAARLIEHTLDLDLSGLLPQIRVPTLIDHPLGFATYPVSVAQSMAAAIPDGRLVLRPESADLEQIYEAMAAVWNSFLDEDPETRALSSARPGPTEHPTGTAVILFADIADSTGLTERLGDGAFRAKARELDAALRTIVAGNGGTTIEGKLLGDGVLAVFTSARQAIEAALACGRAGADGALPLHLGLHAGDVIREEGNVYGGAVNIAARIAALSAPGELLVSDTVRSLARTSAGAAFEDRGEQALKGVGETVRVFAVKWANN